MSGLPVSRPDLKSVQAKLEAAGVEIYSSQREELQVAERVRFHIMDSGVRVRLDDRVRVQFTARSQRSDFPHDEPDALFEKVRGEVGAHATPRGYREALTATIEVKDPVDETRVLDVWHEVTYEKEADVDTVIDEVKWALEVEKYVNG